MARRVYIKYGKHPIRLFSSKAKAKKFKTRLNKTSGWKASRVVKIPRERVYFVAGKKK